MLSMCEAISLHKYTKQIEIFKSTSGINLDVSDGMSGQLLHKDVNQKEPMVSICSQNELFNPSTVHLSTAQFSNCEGG